MENLEEFVEKTFSLNLSQLKFDDEGVPTATSVAQEKLEEQVSALYKEKKDELPELKRAEQIIYLLKTLRHLPASYEVMDCSLTWLIYWNLNSLAILDHELDNCLKEDIIEFLKSCQHPDGGFGGGPGQDPHFAPTYAAVNALCLLGTKEAFEVVNRKTMLKFLKTMKVGDGSFFMHNGGEIDLRSVYCCAVLTTLLNIDDPNLFENSVNWIKSCQSYEGGFGSNPCLEAHGGYTFCALGALYLLSSLDKCDLKSLRRWILRRQTTLERGFQGRTNKLVDSCYSFWQCASFAIANFKLITGKMFQEDHWHIDNKGLQEYLLLCCQHISGGFIDKPGTNQDQYHTCYALSGLSLSFSAENSTKTQTKTGNTLVDIHPVYNIPITAFQAAQRYFKEEVNEIFDCEEK